MLSNLILSYMPKNINYRATVTLDFEYITKYYIAKKYSNVDVVDI